MIANVKRLLGEHEENLGKWVKVTSDEEDAIRESLAGTNFERGSTGKQSLRLYSKDGHVVACTSSAQAGPHPSEKS
jgi:hypothetical protein